MKQLYTINFHGRHVGAIGLSDNYVTTRMAETPNDAILACYDAFDHIHGARVYLDGKLVQTWVK